MSEKYVLTYTKGYTSGSIHLNYYPTLKSKIYGRGFIDFLREWNAERLLNNEKNGDDLTNWSRHKWRCRLEIGINHFLSKKLMYEVIGETSYNYDTNNNYDNPLSFGLRGSVTWYIL